MLNFFRGFAECFCTLSKFCMFPFFPQLLLLQSNFQRAIIYQEAQHPKLKPILFTCESICCMFLRGFAECFCTLSKFCMFPFFPQLLLLQSNFLRAIIYQKAQHPKLKPILFTCESICWICLRGFAECFCTLSKFCMFPFFPQLLLLQSNIQRAITYEKVQHPNLKPILFTCESICWIFLRGFAECFCTLSKFCMFPFFPQLLLLQSNFQRAITYQKVQHPNLKPILFTCESICWMSSCRAISKEL